MERDFLKYFASCVIKGFELTSRQRPYVYLEFGISIGGTFNEIAPLFDIAYAVDIDNCLSFIEHNSNLVWFNGTTDNFIKQLSNVCFDYVFIDADHSYSQSLQDFKGILPFVRDNGFIVLHDTYPMTTAMMNMNVSGTVYKTAWDIRTQYNRQCEIITIPSEYGLSIIRKSDKQLHWID